MNMVRAGVVAHPSEWLHSGYHEIQTPPKRYSIIDHQALMKLGGFQDMKSLQQAHQKWISTHIKQRHYERQSLWSDSVAVGSERYVENIQAALGTRAKGRKCQSENDHYILKEPEAAYGVRFTSKMDALSD